jgi:hypothetical protein
MLVIIKWRKQVISGFSEAKQIDLREDAEINARLKAQGTSPVSKEQVIRQPVYEIDGLCGER